MYRIKEIESKKTFEDFILKSKVALSPFFQSWNWSLVQTALGNKVFRLGMYKDSELVLTCLVVKIKARRGTYFHLRHGPIFKNKEVLKPFIIEITKLAKEEKVDFIRLSPLVQTQADLNSLKGFGIRNAPIHNMDAENAWILDVSKSEEELLSEMRKTTRYLVRKAMKLPIEVKKTTDMKGFQAFLKLYEETSKRHHFVPHRGMKEELDIFSKDDQTVLYLAYFNKKLIAGALIVFYGNQAVYHHGASADEFRDIPAAYLLQWEAIKEAKKRGKMFYNFWGVVPPDKPKHPWQGITLFKTGFGGTSINFVHAQDIPLGTSYWKTFIIETFWRIRKGY